MVERDLPKVDVEGSSPFSRSKTDGAYAPHHHGRAPSVTEIASSEERNEHACVRGKVRVERPFAMAVWPSARSLNGLCCRRQIRQVPCTGAVHRRHLQIERTRHG